MHYPPLLSLAVGALLVTSAGCAPGTIDTTPPDGTDSTCVAGAIVAPCACGDESATSGYCCSGRWQLGECAFVQTIQAESGHVAGRMGATDGVLGDPACGDSWVEVPAGEPDFVWDPAAPSLPAHRGEFPIDLPHVGTYYVWLRMASFSSANDALYVGFEAADMRRVYPPDGYPYDGTWVWVSAVAGAADRLVFNDLAAGAHTLIVAHGEAGTRCDEVVIANSQSAAFDRTCGPAADCADGETQSRACAVPHGSGVEIRICGGGVWGVYDSCEVADCDVGYHLVGAGCVENAGSYPFQGYTSTRGAFEAVVDGEPAPRILVVDSLSAIGSDGDETSGRGSLPWALARSYPRVILFEVSGVIHVGGDLNVTSPYVSVHGQTAPPPGLTLNDVSVSIATHDVIFQHLRVRMGATEHGGGDPLTVCGVGGDSVHDIIIDHCSAGLGHDEQLSISTCGVGDVRRVTLSNNIMSFGLNYAGHAYGTLIDSGDSNAYGVDEILVDGNLFSQLVFRTPMLNHAARHVTVTNNVTYNAKWNGMQIESRQYPEGQFFDIMHNLYWRGPETEDIGTWPTDEVATWPTEPDLWPATWNANRRPVSAFFGTSGGNTHVYYAANYDYVNNEDYTYGDHEGRPVELASERYIAGEITAADIAATTRQTGVAVLLLTPAQVEAHVQVGVGCTPSNRDALDALSVSDAFARTGGYIDRVSDLSVAPLPTGGASRTLGSIGGYPAGSELADSDGDGLTDVEEWIYGL